MDTIRRIIGAVAERLKFRKELTLEERAKLAKVAVDGAIVAFNTAADAVLATAEAQQLLADEAWKRAEQLRAAAYQSEEFGDELDVEAEKNRLRAERIRDLVA